MKIEVCMGTNCMMNGAMQLYDQLQSLNELIADNPDYYKVDEIIVEPTKCQKNCKLHEDYKDCTVIVDGHMVDDMKGTELLEYVMNTIKN